MRNLVTALSALALTSCSMLPFGDGDTPASASKDAPTIAIANSWATVAPTGVKQAAGFSDDHQYIGC